MPGLQQAAGTAATVTEKAVKNVEKPVKEAVEALDKAATKNRKVKKSAEDAARSLEKEKEKVIGLDATLSEAGDDAGEKITESLEKTAEETESLDVGRMAKQSPALFVAGRSRRQSSNTTHISQNME